MEETTTTSTTEITPAATTSAPKSGAMSNRKAVIGLAVVAVVVVVAIIAGAVWFFSRSQSAAGINAAQPEQAAAKLNSQAAELLEKVANAKDATDLQKSLEGQFSPQNSSLDMTLALQVPAAEMDLTLTMNGKGNTANQAEYTGKLKGIYADQTTGAKTNLDVDFSMVITEEAFYIKASNLPAEYAESLKGSFEENKWYKMPIERATEASNELGDTSSLKDLAAEIRSKGLFTEAQAADSVTINGKTVPCMKAKINPALGSSAAATSGMNLESFLKTFPPITLCNGTDALPVQGSLEITYPGLASMNMKVTMDSLSAAPTITIPADAEEIKQ